MVTRMMAALVLAAVGPGMTHAAPPIFQAFDASVPHVPAPVRSDGATIVFYELHLTNFASRPLILTRIEVMDAATGTVLLALSDAALERALGSAKAAIVAPGARGIVYLELPIDGANPPRALRHRVAFAAGEGEGRVAGAFETGSADIDDHPLPILGPPLKGGGWTAVYAPEMERGHRRVVYAVDGKARIPGRFAIDWMKVDKAGKLSRGDGDIVASSYSYGAEVLAVADAVVAAVRDDVPDPQTKSAAPRPTLGDATGNYIALDLGGGRYAYYEHLKQGVRVKPGEKVKKGQVIALLGFTGQASSPHLHFHVADTLSPLGAEGQPYLLEGYTVIGAYPSIDAFGQGPWTPVREAGRAEPSLPGPNVVVRFAD